MTKDYIDYRKTQTSKTEESETASEKEWDDEFYGLPEYRDYYETWC